jgi:hypothetical protein
MAGIVRSTGAHLPFKSSTSVYPLVAMALYIPHCFLNIYSPLHMQTVEPVRCVDSPVTGIQHLTDPTQTQNDIYACSTLRYVEHQPLNLGRDFD